MQEFEDMMDSDFSEAIEDISDRATFDTGAGTVERFVQEKFRKAKDSRLVDEERWISAYRNYRGIYGPDVQFTSTEKSKVFVKVTKTKVLAAYGQIIDVLFGANRFPITIDPTTCLLYTSDAADE